MLSPHKVACARGFDDKKTFEAERIVGHPQARKADEQSENRHHDEITEFECDVRPASGSERPITFTKPGHESRDTDGDDRRANRTVHRVILPKGTESESVEDAKIDHVSTKERPRSCQRRRHARDLLAN